MPEKQDSKSNADSNKSVEDTHAKIKHVSGHLNADDLYALSNKRSVAKSAANVIDKNENKVHEVESDEKEDGDNKDATESIEDKDANKDLPFGWEKHEDNDGPYYWHIKSGTIQREPPLFPKEPTTQTDIKTPSSGLHQSPSLLHMQATSSVNKISSQSHYYNTGMGFNIRAQVLL